MNEDDLVNVGILAAALLFMAYAVPSRFAEHNDAMFGADVRQPFTLSESEYRTDSCIAERGYEEADRCTLEEMKRTMGAGLTPRGRNAE